MHNQLEHFSILPQTRFRILGWNVRAGGGKRVAGILQQICSWSPDVIALSEFRDTPPSRWLATQLAEHGFFHQRYPADPLGTNKAQATENLLPAAKNRVFIASRYPLRIRHSKFAPNEPGRWLLAQVFGPAPFLLGVMHIPNQVTGRKPHYHQQVVALAKHYRNKPAVFIGDTNSGQIELDEENPVFNKPTDQWFRDLQTYGFEDAFRFSHGDRREYTWYSPNKGNGFRLDQAFISKPLIANFSTIRHLWGSANGMAVHAKHPRREALSDHAAVLVDFYQQSKH